MSDAVLLENPKLLYAVWVDPLHKSIYSGESIWAQMVTGSPSDNEHWDRWRGLVAVEENSR